MYRLNNKTALITGGNSGIGLATAKAFIQEGARVIITGRNEAAVTAAVGELGNGTTGIVSDTGSMKDIATLKAQVSALTSSLDIVFINAGIGKFLPIEFVDEAHFDEQFNINVKGAYFTIQQLLPLVNEGGSIILNTSVSAHLGMPGSSVYSATKAALLSFAKTLSAELTAKRIRVNAISPGPIDTPILEKTGANAEQLKEMAERLTAMVPLGRFGKPEEIARVASFFASDDSSYVLGAELIAGGGVATL